MEKYASPYFLWKNIIFPQQPILRFQVLLPVCFQMDSFLPFYNYKTLKMNFKLENLKIELLKMQVLQIVLDFEKCIFILSIYSYAVDDLERFCNRQTGAINFRKRFSRGCWRSSAILSHNEVPASYDKSNKITALDGNVTGRADILFIFRDRTMAGHNLLIEYE